MFIISIHFYNKPKNISKELKKNYVNLQTYSNGTYLQSLFTDPITEPIVNLRNLLSPILLTEEKNRFSKKHCLRGK